MNRKLFVGVFAAAVLIGGVTAPMLSSAQTETGIQAQISDLLSKINELTKQLNDLRSRVGGQPTWTDPTTPPMPPPFSHRICGLVNRNLGKGVSGDDVRGLQEFLHENKYLPVTPTGYFGQMTADAVKKWQAQEGVSAVGTFGPASRERIKVWCGDKWGGNQERFSATPTRGDAPLTVTFNTWRSGFRVNTISYSIDYGDGTSERAADCPAPADACTGPGVNTHTYSQNGTYTASLVKITKVECNGANEAVCTSSAGGKVETVARTEIVVGPVACTKEYKPVCGAKPIVCITTPCNPIPTTYGNRCEMNADGAQFLYEGQCRSDWQNPADDPKCKAWYDGCNSCSRGAPGEPAMCTLRACMAEHMAKPYCTAWFDSSDNKPPTISGFSGPTTLVVNSTGTWSINASDPENGQLTYQIWWGDENVYAPNYMAASAREFTQSTSFTHAYRDAGTFTIKLIVTDSFGNQAKTTSTVKVTSASQSGGTVCTADAYQCPNGQWVGRTGPNCQFVCPTTASGTTGTVSCTFDNTPVGNACGGQYHCAAGVNYHYWSATYTSSCISAR